ncbi:MAG: membrane protein insertase YidC [Planctomycetota bacterium]
MEKRLPLALFLSFLVLFGWQMAFPPPPVKDVVDESVPADDLTREPTARAAEHPEPRIAAETEALSDPVVFGEKGQPGHWRGVFSNRGARLVGLEFLDYFRYFRHEGLTESEVLAREEKTHMPLIVPSAVPDRSGGAFAWETSESSHELAPLGLDEALWRMEVEGQEVRFVYGASSGVTFRKTVKPVPGTWLLEVELEVENGSEHAGGLREFLFRPAGFVPPELGDRFYPEPRAVAIGGTDDDLDVEWEQAAGNIGESGVLDAQRPLAAVGVHNKYFAFLMREHPTNPAPTMMEARWRAFLEPNPAAALVEDLLPGADHSLPPLPPERVGLVVPLKLRFPAPGETAVYRYLFYAGPKDRQTMVADAPASAALLDEDLSSFDSLSAIGRGLLAILRVLHGWVGNWGVAIILLTLGLRIVLFPLQRRSQTAMARYSKTMKRVQPRLEELKTKFADDVQRQRQEQARIMQEEGAFPPLGGCLPLFLQIPVFIGLFSALRTSFDLRQAPFAFWIDDLSQPDRLFELGVQIPLLITTLDFSYFNLLPILMVVLWILQQRGMPTPTDPQQAKMQKLMTFMPIVFGFMLYNYAAGLSLYMMTQSGLGIIEQRVIKKVWPIDDTVPEKKKPGGCGPFSGAMQNLAEKQRIEMERRQAMLRKQQANRPKGGSKKKKR